MMPTVLKKSLFLNHRTYKQKNTAMPTVIIPTPLRKFTENAPRLDVEAGNVGELVQSLADRFPQLKKHLLDEAGQLRTFLNIFVGDEDIRDLHQEKTALTKETVVSIVPAIAGG